jgi:hypothetical protein
MKAVISIRTSGNTTPTGRLESAAFGTSNLEMKIVVSGADDVPNADQWLFCAVAL